MDCARLVTLSLATTFCMGCVGGQDTSPLPRTLHGLRRMEVLSGEDAERAISRLHGQPVATSESHVARYEEDGIAATLYLSRFAAPDQASEQVRTMAERIRAGVSGFGHYRALIITGIPVHSVLGQGKIHFFYATGMDAVWIGAHPLLARTALGELLDVHPDSIPNLMPAAPVGAGMASASNS